MGETDLVERLNLTEEICCDIRRHGALVRAHLYPLYPQAYWSRHLDYDLTEREVRVILEAIQRAKAKP